MNKACCRMCEKIYSDKSSSKHNIFVTRNSDITLRQRLLKVQIEIEKLEGFSDTVCRTCWNAVKKIEDSRKIQNVWKENLGKQIARSTRSLHPVKRFLSPSSKLVSNEENDTVQVKLLLVYISWCI